VTDFPDIITVTLGSLVTELYAM